MAVLRRRWRPALTLAGLAPAYRGRVMLPVLDPVHRAGAVDLVTVGLVDRPVPGGLRGADGESGARVRRVPVPGPRCRTGLSRSWSWSGLTPSPTPSPPCPSLRRAEPGRGAGGPVRGRVPVAAAAGRDSSADRWRNRVGEGVGDLVDDPCPDPRNGSGMGARCGRWTRSGWALSGPGPVRPVRRARGRPWSPCWRPRSGGCMTGRQSLAGRPAPSPPRRSSVPGPGH